MVVRYFRRRWSERRGDAYDAWGAADYFFETDDDLIATRQVEVYEAGQRLLYDASHDEDEFGSLGSGRVLPEADDESKFEISAAEFDKAWLRGRRIKLVLDVDAVLGSIEILQGGGHYLADLFAAAGVNETSDEDLLEAVRSALQHQPDTIRIWQSWSYDKRWSPSPYLDGMEVGHYDAGAQHVRQHTTVVDACADFVLAEVRWTVERRVVEHS